MFYKCQLSEKDFEQLSGISWGEIQTADKFIKSSIP